MDDLQNQYMLYNVYRDDFMGIYPYTNVYGKGLNFCDLIRSIDGGNIFTNCIANCLAKCFTNILIIVTPLRAGKVHSSACHGKYLTLQDE